MTRSVVTVVKASRIATAVTAPVGLPLAQASRISSWISSKPLHPKVVVTSSEDEEDTEELVPQKKVSAFKLEEMKETGGRKSGT